ncbi:protein of unknown function [Candidatus Hydrogenisulfobacillus filiaventi]|uniref:Uncharacterized protein n=1 Tax=Candidatus Hydrogenisulfobacillus filiaventi TaxID=2707344 RepID=A0A6F8ZJC0_9FIRM|nr:protein of unknown function [Candidatus Hydrogenisulfobacillus filiaventi]
MDKQNKLNEKESAFLARWTSAAGPEVDEVMILEKDGDTVVLVGWRGCGTARIGLADLIRTLRRMGVDPASAEMEADDDGPTLFLSFPI